MSLRGIAAALLLSVCAIVAAAQDAEEESSESLSERLSSLEKRQEKTERELEAARHELRATRYVLDRAFAIETEIDFYLEAIEDDSDKVEIPPTEGDALGRPDPKELEEALRADRELRVAELREELRRVLAARPGKGLAEYLADRRKVLEDSRDSFERLLAGLTEATEPLRAAYQESLSRIVEELARVDDLLAKEAPPAATPEGMLWALDLASDSKGSGHLADIDGDGKLEIVFGTYFGDEHLYAVNAEDGSLLWRFKSQGGPFDASVAIADLDGDATLEILAADSATGALFCLNGAGEELWRMKLPSGTDSPPAIGDLNGDGKPEIVAGSMWQGDGHGHVSAIDPRKREILWSRRLHGCVQSEPTLADIDYDGMLDVVVATWRGDHCVHALRGSDGEPIWSFQTEGDDESMGMYHGVAVVPDDSDPWLVFSTCQGDVYAVDFEGKQLWHKHYDDYLFAPPTVEDFEGDGCYTVIVGGTSLRALDCETGAEHWSVEGLAFIDRGCVTVDLDGDGKRDLLVPAGKEILGFRGSDGKEIFRFNGAQNIDDPYEDISSALLLGDFNGDGELEFFAVCGRGYSGEWEKNNRGRAFAVPLPGAKDEPWTTFRGGLRRAGRR